jgi:hypothetical protein
MTIQGVGPEFNQVCVTFQPWHFLFYHVASCHSPCDSLSRTQASRVSLSAQLPTQNQVRVTGGKNQQQLLVFLLSQVFDCPVHVNTSSSVNFSAWVLTHLSWDLNRLFWVQWIQGLVKALEMVLCAIHLQRFPFHKYSFFSQRNWLVTQSQTSLCNSRNFKIDQRLYQTFLLSYL